MTEELTEEDLKEINKILKSIYRNKSYFTRGHNLWTSYILSIISFITIFYVLLGTQFPFLHTLFPDILIFGIIFGIGYFIIGNLIGRFDIKHGPLAVENILAFVNNPPFQELVRKVERLDNKLDRLLAIFDGADAK